MSKKTGSFYSEECSRGVTQQIRESRSAVKKNEYSELVVPVVVFPKKLCEIVGGNYRIILNPAVDVEQYPLPWSEEIFATLAEGKYFSVLDLLNAY